MSWLVYSGLILFTLFGLYAWLIVHARTESIYRPVAVGVFLTSFPAILLAYSFILGTAVPTGYFVFQIPQGRYAILGCKSVPKTGIFLLLNTGDNTPPAFYRLPWDVKMSMRIEEQGCRGILESEDRPDAIPVGKWEFSWNQNRPLVTTEEPPQKALPDKILPESAPGMVLPPSD